MPCHHNLEAWLHAYIDGCGLGLDPKGPLFRTIGRGTGRLSGTRLIQQDAHDLIRVRALAVDIDTKIGNHTFRATGIRAYLKNGGTLEKAAAMANHSSTRTTQLYDQHDDQTRSRWTRSSGWEFELSLVGDNRSTGSMNVSVAHDR